MNVEIAFGALSPAIGEQLAQQGLAAAPQSATQTAKDVT